MRFFFMLDVNFSVIHGFSFIILSLHWNGLTNTNMQIVQASYGAYRISKVIKKRSTFVARHRIGMNDLSIFTC